MIGRPRGPGGSLLRLTRLREAAKTMTKTKSATSTGGMTAGGGRVASTIQILHVPTVNIDRRNETCSYESVN